MKFVKAIFRLSFPSIFLWICVTGFCQGFTYQGYLSDGGQPATGQFGMQFNLFLTETNGAPVTSAVLLPKVCVTNGVFNVLLDFGINALKENPLWLEIGIADTNSSGGFHILAPRQFLSVNAYAVRAQVSDTALKADTAQSVNWSGVQNVPATVVQAGERFAAIFGSAEAFTQVSEIGSPGSINWIRETSTFSGFGQGIGVVQGFSAIKFYIRAWDATHPITKVRCRIKEGDYNGRVVADKTVNYSGAIGQATLVTLNFSSTIQNSEGKKLWLEYFTDGRVGQTRVSNGVPPPPDEMYSVTANVDDTTMYQAYSNQSFYVGFYQGEMIVDDQVLNDAFKNKLEVIPTKDSVHIDLPDVLYALEGTEFNIYFQNVLRLNVPFSQLEARVTCDKGSLYERLWRYLPAAGEAGVYPLTLSVYSGNKLVASKQSKLVVSDLSAGSGISRQILMIGDSTTANGIMAGELVKLFSSDAMRIRLRGTKGTAPALVEAVSGWSLDTFYANPRSPFLVNGKFDFAQYLENNGITLNSGDWVTINLGINDLFWVKTDEDLNPQIRFMTNMLSGMITGIKQTIPGIRIGVAITIPPPGGQDSFGLFYGTYQTYCRYAYNNKIWVETLLASFGNLEASGIYLIPIEVNLDTIYNYTTKAIPVNARNPTLTFTTTWNGVHPDVPGYGQIADSFRAFFKAHL